MDLGAAHRCAVDRVLAGTRAGPCVGVLWVLGDVDLDRQQLVVAFHGGATCRLGSRESQQSHGRWSPTVASGIPGVTAKLPSAKNGSETQVRCVHELSVVDKVANRHHGLKATLEQNPRRSLAGIADRPRDGRFPPIAWAIFKNRCNRDPRACAGSAGSLGRKPHFGFVVEINASASDSVLACLGRPFELNPPFDCRELQFVVKD